MMESLMKTLLILLMYGYVVRLDSGGGKCETREDGVNCDNMHNDGAQIYSRTDKVAGTDSTHCADDRSFPKHNLSVVVCGDRLNESLIMLKSAVIFTHEPFHVHIFAENVLHAQLQQQLSGWPDVVSRRMTFTLYPIQFPAGLDAKVWKELFKLCASQRIFIPDILPDVDALLYVDTDVLFLRPLHDIWKFFDKFNSTQIAAVAPEHEEPTASWYARFARHPYVPPYGVNSGVMLMNLTRMRNCQWVKYMVSYFNTYRYNTTWGDQDLINIFFHFFPEKLYQYTCDWNYRPDHCMYMSNCKSAESYGVSMLHGSRRAFHRDKWPVFRAMYQSVGNHKFSDDINKLLQNMLANINSTPHSTCSAVAYVFTKQIDGQHHTEL